MNIELTTEEKINLLNTRFNIMASFLYDVYDMDTTTCPDKILEQIETLYKELYEDFIKILESYHDRKNQ